MCLFVFYCLLYESIYEMKKIGEMENVLVGVMD